MPFDRTTLYAVDRTWLPKFILRTLLAALAIAAIGCYGRTVAQRGFGFYYSTVFTYFVFIPLGLSFLWFAISTIYLFLKSKPLHPGWHVGWDLVLTAGYIVFNIFLWFEAVSNYIGAISFDPSDYDYSYGYGPSEGEVNAAKSMARTQLAGVIFLATLLLLHFTLFVWACVDTETRRRNKYARRMAHDMISEMRARGELPPVQYPLLNNAGGPAYTTQSYMPTAQTPYSQGYQA